MKVLKNRLGSAFAVAASAVLLTAQTASGPPDRAEAAELLDEIVGAMETSAVVMPELARAAAPLTENVRQGALTLRTGASREHVGVLYKLLTNARVYLQLVDALPKPPDFSADVRRQIEEIRARVDRLDLYFRNLLERREEQIRQADRDNLARYAEANAQLGPAAVKEQRVVFLGDSITDGWELNQYFPGKPYVNRGISGQITGQMLGRLKADVLDLRPKAMVLLGGTNDLSRGVSIQAIQDNIFMIARLAEAHGVQPVLASLLPVSDYHEDRDPAYKRTALRSPERIREINDWLRRFCADNGYVFLDYHAALVDERGRLAASYSDDGLHPNAEGYKRLAPAAQAAVEQALAPRRAPAQQRKRFGIF